MTIHSAPRTFQTRDSAIRYMEARDLNPATHTLVLVQGVGYILRSIGYDPALASR